MKITTGLVPTATPVRIPTADLRTQRFEFNGGSMALRVPDSFGVDVWTLRLDAPEDAPERRQGTPRALLLLDSEPTIEKRGVVFRLLDEHAEVHDLITARERERAGCPADAVVTDVRYWQTRHVERRIEWWEVTA